MKKEIKTQIERKKRERINYKWIIKIVIATFIISLLFSLLSETVIRDVNVYIAIIILIVIISIGILFDMIGVAVTAADIEPFHSMSSRKVNGAKIAVNFKKNADKVSSFCNDVIGDICGIISGTVGVTIALSLTKVLNIPLLISSLIVTSLIASLTIGGKAIFKSVAINKSNEILYEFAKIINMFKKQK
ncbi:MAG: hypothetical protein RSB71_03405 [Bacilli bacterium]